RMEVHPTELELAKVRDYAERTFRPLAEEKGLEFTIEVEAGMRASIVSDEQRLHQILKNLLSNAFKFTDAGSVSLRLSPAPPEARYSAKTLAEADDVIAFSVADTGIGIDAEKLRIIFEAFQQADGTTSRRYGGTGLGLSISREIAHLLGGEIAVSSRPDEGATFTLYLPTTMPAREALPDLQADLAPRAADLPRHDPVPDDRHEIEPGDRVVLIVEDDTAFAKTVLDIAHERGFKCLVALRGDTGLALARKFKPDAIVLDLVLPAMPGQEVLEHLKGSPDTRHIPVHIVSGGNGRQDALRAGAVAYLEKPVTKEKLDEAFEGIASFIERPVRRLLVVDDDEAQRASIIDLVGADDVEIEAVGSSEEALEYLEASRFDCMVLDLKLPGRSGFALLEQVKQDERFRELPVIIYTGKELTKREETRLRRYAETIVVKDVSSPERLLDETSLFLHRVESRLPAPKRRMLEQLHDADAVFSGKRILIVDDDVRNVFALTSVLESHGMEVLFAENGLEGLQTIEKNPDIDLVLMDIMMPELDGYETTRRIRAQPAFEGLPIIALTAKAMKGDREKSIAAGASDYVPKPVDTDQLVSLMRVWLYK
ncbi:MAG: response regulator, partial [Actinomycetota bacterium]|nr:response regulator [Actinomycetota bacterium]